MPAILSGKVLVSGANGFVPAWIITELLQEGLSVRAAVRSEAKTAHLHKLFASHADKFESVIVRDITTDGAFDDAVKGVDAIIHTASPFTFALEDPNDFIVPAVKGTVGILESARHHAHDCKRISVLSSTAAVEYRGTEPLIMDETYWNDQAVQAVETSGKDADPVAKYCASKTLAERAAWDFYEKHKSALPWDLVVLNPPFVFGPVINEVDSPEKLGASMLQMYISVLKGQSDEAFLQAFCNAWIDVRDVAHAHIIALKTPEAGGERIIISVDPFNWYDWAPVGKAISADLPDYAKSYDPSTAKYIVDFDTSKADKILGLKYRTKEETLRDIIVDFQTKGWL